MLTVDLNLDLLNPVKPSDAAGNKAVTVAFNPATKESLMRSIRITQLKRLAMAGVKPADAAERLGCSVETVRRHYADPEFRKMVMGNVEGAFAEFDANYQKERLSWAEKREGAAVKAFKKLEQMMEDPNTTEAGLIRIAQDFLDRLPDTQQQHKTVYEFNLDPDQLASAAAVAAEIESFKGRKIIDVTPER